MNDDFHPDTLIFLNRFAILTHTLRDTTHELNNVIQTISGSAELLASKPGLPEAVLPRIDTIARNAERSRELLQTLGGLVPRGEAAARRMPLVEAFEAVGRLRRHGLMKAGLSYVVTAEDREACAAGDPAMLQQLGLNLVLAIERELAGPMGRKGEVRVSIGGDAARVTAVIQGTASADPAPVTTPVPAALDAAYDAAGVGLDAAAIIATRLRGEVRYDPFARRIDLALPRG